MWVCHCGKHCTTVDTPGGDFPTEEVPCPGDPEERYSLGIYAGKWCDRCWRECSGYRDEPASAFDPLDAGESYDAD